jgi:hypothetical protein
MFVSIIPSLDAERITRLRLNTKKHASVYIKDTTGKAQETVSVPSLTPTPLSLQGLVAEMNSCL